MICHCFLAIFQHIDFDLSKCYNIPRQYVDVLRRRFCVISTQNLTERTIAMNIRNLFLALVATIAFSFAGKAFDLPFGDANMREYATTNINIVAVEVFQLVPDTDDEYTHFMGSNFGIKFNTYAEFMNYVRGKLHLVETRFLEPKLLPEEDVYIFVAAGTPGANGDFYDSFLGYHITRLVNVGGSWKFPAGFVDMFTPKFDNYSVIRLQKPVEWAKIVSLNSVTDSLIALHDTRINQADDREVKVDSNANLMVRREYTLNDPSKKVYLTVGYEDGTTQAWGGDGKEIPVPAPTLSLTSSVDDGLVLVLNHGNIGSTVQIQCSDDLRNWTNFQSFQTTQYVSRISIQSSNPPSCFFRLTE